MGQRHQVYLFLKDDAGKTHGTGIHHQWLYGANAGLRTTQFMEFQKKSNGDKYNAINKVYFGGLHVTTEAMQAFYMVNWEHGFVSTSAHFIGEAPQDKWEKQCVIDPRHGDNNDGITVYDFTDLKKPTYCMVNIAACKENHEGSVCFLKPFKACSVEEYIRAYDPIGGTEYQRKEWDAAKFAKNEKDILPILKRASKFHIMKQARLEEIFPVMFGAKPKKDYSNAALSLLAHA
jgi:hypothetical protein